MRKYIVTVNGKKFEVEVEEAAAAQVAQAAPAPVQQAAPAAPSAPMAAPAPAQAAPGAKTIKAPMPGTIIDVKVNPGQSVKRGDVLFILEAMKMENEIMAGEEGVIASVAVSKGTTVNTDDLLASMQ